MNEQLNGQTNNNERRFELATETSARTRLDNFRDGIKNFQKENPEVLGATVYGSMIKGEQAKETSDVDAFLYIDKETIQNKELLQNKDNYIGIKYLDKFMKSLDISNEEEQKYYHDLRSKLLSNEIIIKDIDDFVQSETKYNTYKKMLGENYTYDLPEEEKEKLLAQEPITQGVDFATAGLFHARVGTGIEKYRHLFLEKVAELSDKEMSHNIWKDIYSQLKTYEQRSDPKKKIEIPATLNDAMRVYHPDLYKNINKKKDEEKIDALRAQISNSF